MLYIYWDVCMKEKLYIFYFIIIIRFKLCIKVFYSLLIISNDERFNEGKMFLK